MGELYEIIDEMSYSIVLSNKDIGPKVYELYIFKSRGRKYGAIVMKRYTSDLTEFIKKFSYRINSTELSNMLFRKYTHMFSIGIFCLDIKTDNILVEYDRDGNIRDIVISDFGSDWCCLSNHCDFKNALRTDKHKFFFEILSFAILSFGVYQKSEHKLILFTPQLQELKNVINKSIFLKFMEELCEYNLCDGSNLYTYFYYLQAYINISKIKGDSVAEYNRNILKRMLSKLKF